MGWPFCSGLKTWLKVLCEAMKKAWQLKVRWAGQEEGQCLPHVLPTHDHPFLALWGPCTHCSYKSKKRQQSFSGIRGHLFQYPCATPAPTDAGALQASSAFVLPSFHYMGLWFAEFLWQSERESAAWAPLLGGGALKLSKNPTLSPHPC